MMKNLAKATISAIAIFGAVTAIAATPKYDRMKAEGDAYILSWKESSGEIIYDSVCYKNKAGSVQYRNCRREAQLLFRDKCNKSDDKSNKWCLAKSRYYPF